MCESVPIVRYVAIFILLIAVGGCLVGLVAPFWALYEPGLSPTTPSIHNRDAGEALSTTVKPNIEIVNAGVIIQKHDRIPAQMEGLWARCDPNNYTNCIIFYQNDFQLEFEFPTWHKICQVLYLVGSVILVATLVVGFFNICCCRCCAESSSLPTALGALTTLGVLPILASIVVYGAMAYVERGITLIAVSASNSGSSVSATPSTAGAGAGSIEQVLDPKTAVFDWAYYVAVASIALCLLSAALLFCDGKRSSGSLVVDDKGRYHQQTAKVEIYGTDQ